MDSRAGWGERSETHQPPTIHLPRLPPDVSHAADNTGKKTPAHPPYLLDLPCNPWGKLLKLQANQKAVPKAEANARVM